MHVRIRLSSEEKNKEKITLGVSRFAFGEIKSEMRIPKAKNISFSKTEFRFFLRF